MKESKILLDTQPQPRILHALDRLASGGSFLVGDTLTLAEIHLAPVMFYFTVAGRRPQSASETWIAERLVDDNIPPSGL